MLEYAFDDNAEWGIAALPTAAYSIPDDVQGACFDESGNIYFSTSGGYSASHILMYGTADMVRVRDILVDGIPITHYVTNVGALRASYKIRL